LKSNSSLGYGNLTIKELDKANQWAVEENQLEMDLFYVFFDV